MAAVNRRRRPLNRTDRVLPTGIARIELPVPYLGSVNLWLLEGEPLTIVDTGPANDETLAALERELAAHGLRIEDLELLVLTHHHLDHTGLAATLKERAGADIAALTPTAAWGVDYQERVAAERSVTRSLLAVHGVPQQLIDDSEPFFTYIVRNSAEYTTDRILVDGDAIRAGGRDLRAIHRPGHSVTDTLFVDDSAGIAFVGDHLLADITSNAEPGLRELPGSERRRALPEYLAGLKMTAAMPLERCLPGHGPAIEDHRALIAERLEFHAIRRDAVASGIDDRGSSAFELAGVLWDDETVATQTVLAIWEVLGHLDLLVADGAVTEDRDGSVHVFRPAA
jgi:glyoxylase-like metal-dependent hydrolase (beta-lactamase superfamily II)